jgi:hypothetical protein
LLNLSHRRSVGLGNSANSAADEAFAGFLADDGDDDVRGMAWGGIRDFVSCFAER